MVRHPFSRLVSGYLDKVGWDNPNFRWLISDVMAVGKNR